MGKNFTTYLEHDALTEKVVYMPNEIFEDFTYDKDSDSNKFKSWKHVAFAFSYYFIISRLYNSCTYGTSTDITKFSPAKIRENVLNYASKKCNYLTKKGGVLEKMGYLETTTDYPMQPDIETVGDNERLVDFHTLSDFKENGYKPTHSPNFCISVPVKGLYRYDDSDNYDGTFFDVSNTTQLYMDSFISCMNNNDLGTVGFYVYAYFRWKTDKFRKGFDISYEEMRSIFKMTDKTIRKTIQALEQEGLVQVFRHHHAKKYSNRYYANRFPKLKHTA